jgi:hypothetical protein
MMQLTSPHRLALSVAAAALFFSAMSAGAARAQTTFDGQWSVEIVANTSACALAYAVPIQVEDGNISYGGGLGAIADGRVGSDGALRVQLTASDVIVHATGALTDGKGLGQWSSATLKCEGTWTARKG